MKLYEAIKSCLITRNSRETIIYDYDISIRLNKKISRKPFLLFKESKC